MEKMKNLNMRYEWLSYNWRCLGIIPVPSKNSRLAQGQGACQVLKRGHRG